MFWTPFFQQSTQRWYEYRCIPRATIVTAGFIINQPTPSVSNSCSVSTCPSLLHFCSMSELFPRRQTRHTCLTSLRARPNSLLFVSWVALFSLYGCTFSETELCSHDRQLDIRLVRHCMRPGTSSHFHAIRENDDNRRVHVV